ncbi:uncharacterized protein LOC104910490 [Meleagris gallopavo]|nr:uncharacterized protein LOC104910490 [Meleagris gallopavo]
MKRKCCGKTMTPHLMTSLGWACNSSVLHSAAMRRGSLQALRHSHSSIKAGPVPRSLTPLSCRLLLCALPGELHPQLPSFGHPTWLCSPFPSDHKLCSLSTSSVMLPIIPNHTSLPLGNGTALLPIPSIPSTHPTPFLSDTLHPTAMSCYDLCRPCSGGPTPLANSCNEPCVRQCQDSQVVIQPSTVVVTLPGPILSSFPQNTAVGSSSSAAVGSALDAQGVAISSGGFGFGGLGCFNGGRARYPC